VDTYLTDELRELRRMVREFVRREVTPRDQAIEEAGELPRDLVAKMADLGLLGLTIPEAYGGMGLGTLGYAVVCEEFGRCHGSLRSLMSVQNGIGVRALITDGTEDQKRRYLPDVAAGRKLVCFCLSEPGAGSDAAAIQATAKRRGDRWVLSGTKHFISWAPIADLFTVWVVTDPGKRAHGGITCFVLERGTPGLSVGRIQRTMGNSVSVVSEVVFEDCEVPDEQRVGEVGRGFAIAMKALDAGRISIGAAALGAAKYLLELSAAYAKQRQTFGRPIADYQAIQWMLADTAVDIHATELMVYDAARRHEAGERVTREAAMAKLFASEMAFRAADRAIQIHGGIGYTRDLPIERMFRDLRLLRIVEGTSEIQRLIIARSVLGD
jgi:acyl-CoA dehydrogenase